MSEEIKFKKMTIGKIREAGLDLFVFFNLESAIPQLKNLPIKLDSWSLVKLYNTLVENTPLITDDTEYFDAMDKIFSLVQSGFLAKSSNDSSKVPQKPS